MTTSIQSSTIAFPVNHRTGRKENTYMIIVNAEDGCYEEHEILASSEQEAHAKADVIAQNSMVDVTFVEVYKIA